MPTITHIASGGTVGVPSETTSTGSFTPTVGGKVYLYVWVEENGHNEGTTPIAVTTTAGTSDTWTKVGESNEVAWNTETFFDCRGALFTCIPTSGARTLQIDVTASIQHYHYAWVIVEVTPNSGDFDPNNAEAQAIVLTATNEGGGNTEASAVSLGGDPTPTNYVLVLGAKSNDANGTVSVPTDYTQLVNNDLAYISSFAFQRTGATSPTATFSDLGTQVGSFGGAIIELLVDVVADNPGTSSADTLKSTPDSLIITNNGQAFLAWYNGSNTVFSVANSAYTGWLLPQTISSQYLRAVRYDELQDCIYVVTSSYTANLNFYRLTRSGGTWSVSSPVAIDSSGVDWGTNVAENGHISVDARGYMWVHMGAWVGSWSQRFFYSTDAGATWTQSLSTSDLSGTQSYTAMGVCGPDRATLLAVTATGGDVVGWRRHLVTDGLTTWSTQQTEDPSTDAEAVIWNNWADRAHGMADGNGVFVYVWGKGDTNDTKIGYTYYESWSDTWANGAHLGGSFQDRQPSLCRVPNSPDLVMVYSRYIGAGNYRIAYRRWMADARAWGPIVDLTDTTSADRRAPMAAVTPDGRILTVWQEGTANPYTIKSGLFTFSSYLNVPTSDFRRKQGSELPNAYWRRSDVSGSASPGGTGHNGETITHIFDINANAQVGDLAIASATINYESAVLTGLSLPAGWSLLWDAWQPTSGDHWVVLYKFVEPGDAGDYQALQWTAGAEYVFSDVVTSLYVGVDQTTPFDAFLVSHEGTTTSHIAPSVWAAYTNDLHVVIAVEDNYSAATTPAGFDERYDNSGAAAAKVYDKVLSANGLTGTVDVVTAAATEGRAASILLKSATSAGAYTPQTDVVLVGSSEVTAKLTAVDVPGALEDDFYLAHVTDNVAGAPTAPAGWTSLGSAPDGANNDIHVFCIKRGASAPSLVWTTGGSIGDYSIQLSVWRNVDPYSPFDTGPRFDTASTSSNPGSLSVTRWGQDSVMVCGLTLGTSQTITVPTSHTEIENRNPAGNGGGGFAMSYRVFTTPGTTGVATWSLGGSSVAATWSAVLRKKGQAPDFAGYEHRIYGANNSALGVEPADTRETDVLLACLQVQNGSSTGVTAPAGWSYIGTAGNNGGQSCDQYWYWIRRGASAPALTWTWTTDNDNYIQIVRIVGTQGMGVPIDGYSSVNNDGATSSVVIPSMNTTTGKTLLVAFGRAWAGLAGNMSGWTEIHDDTGGAELDSYWVDGPTEAGATGTATYTDAGSAAMMAAMIAIRPSDYVLIPVSQAFLALIEAQEGVSATLTALTENLGDGSGNPFDFSLRDSGTVFDIALAVGGGTPVSQTFVAIIEALQALSLVPVLPIEGVQQASMLISTLTEAVQQIAAANQEQIEALGGLSSQQVNLIEALTEVSAASDSMLEALHQESMLLTTRTEALQALLQTREMVIEATSGIGSAHVTSIEALQLAQFQHAINIEASQVVVPFSMTVQYEGLAAANALAAAIIEALGGAVIASVLHTEVEQTTAFTLAAFPLEALASLVMTGVVSLETLQDIVEASPIPVETQANISLILGTIATEAQQGVAAGEEAQTEALQYTEIVNPIQTEGMALVSVDIEATTEAVVGVKEFTQAIIEALGGVSSLLGAPTEVLYDGLVVSALAEVPIEAIQNLRLTSVPLTEVIAGISSLMDVEYETAQGLYAVVQFLSEAAQGLSIPIEAGIEAMQQMGFAEDIALEALANLVSVNGNPIEALMGLSLTRESAVEVLNGVIASTTNPIESLEGVMAVHEGDVEALSGLTATVENHIEALFALSQGLVTHPEAIALVAFTVAAPSEATRGLASTVESLIEALGGVASAVSLQIENLGSPGVITALAVMPIEALQILSIQQQTLEEAVLNIAEQVTVEIEAQLGITKDELVPVEALLNLTASKVFPIEAYGSLLMALSLKTEGLVGVNLVVEQLKVEALSGVTRGNVAIIEAAQRLALAKEGPIEALQELLVDEVFTLEANLGVAKLIETAFEATQTVRLLQVLPIEARVALARLSIILGIIEAYTEITGLLPLAQVIEGYADAQDVDGLWYTDPNLNDQY